MAHRSYRVLAALALAAAAGFGGSLAAQGTSASPDVLTALLVEVRGLRAAMEQMASAGPRIQLALGRLQLQEQRVNTVLRRHTDVRERVATTEREAATVSRDIERLQDLTPSASTEDQRREIQTQLNLFKDRYAEINADLQRFRAEEVEAAQLLGAEQSRWTEINERLEELERALTRR